MVQFEVGAVGAPVVMPASPAPGVCVLVVVGGAGKVVAYVVEFGQGADFNEAVVVIVDVSGIKGAVAVGVHTARAAHT